ncbi:MAG: hypothetical protein WC683_15790 [bacterium]
MIIPIPSKATIYAAVGAAVIVGLACAFYGAYRKGYNRCQNEALAGQVEAISEAERKHEVLGKIMLEREREIAGGVDLPERVSELLSTWPDTPRPARTP